MVDSSGHISSNRSVAAMLFGDPREGGKKLCVDRPPQVLIRLFVSDIAAGLAQLAMKPETLDQCDVTDRKLLLALRGVGPESEAESVRFHGREVTKVGREIKHGHGSKIRTAGSSKAGQYAASPL
jgi:hypothetical protein